MTARYLITTTIIHIAALLLVAALVYIRPVGAEDDCAFNTYAVERLPVIDVLVCIGE